jgi:hypothetical protein
MAADMEGDSVSTCAAVLLVCTCLLKLLPHVCPTPFLHAGVADVLSTIIGAEMLKIVPGRVSTEVCVTCACCVGGTMQVQRLGPV